MPFLSHAPTIAVVVPLRSAENTVGEAPKSASPVCWLAGTCQESKSDRPVPDSRTIDSAYSGAGLPMPLPVVAKTEPSPNVETARLLQTLPPALPGTVCQEPSGAPVSWLNSTTPAGTSGASQSEEMPT